jgi:hypothetical protein
MFKPNCRDHFTNEGMHTAMRQYAASKEKPQLSVFVTYADGSSGLLHTFERAKIQEKYKTPDGDFYYQDVDSGKFEPDFLPCENPLSIKELKKLVMAWLESSKPVAIKYELI